MGDAQFYEQWLNENWWSGLLFVAGVFFVTTVVVGLVSSRWVRSFGLAIQGALLVGMLGAAWQYEAMQPGGFGKCSSRSSGNFDLGCSRVAFHFDIPVSAGLGLLPLYVFSIEMVLIGRSRLAAQSGREARLLIVTSAALGLAAGAACGFLVLWHGYSVRPLRLLQEFLFGALFYLGYHLPIHLRPLIWVRSTIRCRRLAQGLSPWRWYAWVMAAPAFAVLVHGAAVCYQNPIGAASGYSHLTALFAFPSLVLVYLLGRFGEIATGEIGS